MVGRGTAPLRSNSNSEYQDHLQDHHRQPQRSQTYSSSLEFDYPNNHTYSIEQGSRENSGRVNNWERVSFRKSTKSFVFLESSSPSTLHPPDNPSLHLLELDQQLFTSSYSLSSFSLFPSNNPQAFPSSALDPTHLTYLQSSLGFLH